MANRIINVAIAGLGRSGYDIHARNLQAMPDRYRVVAVADGIKARRVEATETLGCNAYVEHGELLAHEGVDLFVNALPSPLHPGITVKALQAGLHCVCEKPAAVSVSDFDTMTAAADAADRVFAPFQNNRFSPFFTRILKVIDSGVLGEIIHVRIAHDKFAYRWDWQTRQDLWGGSLNNSGPHALDHAVMLFGSNSPKVFSKLVSGPGSAGDADDFASVTLHGPNSPTVEVLVSSYGAYPAADSYVVNGSTGGLAGGEKELRWRYFDPAKTARHELLRGWSPQRQYCRAEIEWAEETWAAPKTDDAFAANVRAFYENLYDVINGRGKLVVTPAQVRRQVEVIEQCHSQNQLCRMESPAS